MNRAVIVEAKRTPIGKAKKMLQHYQPQELVAPLLSHLSRNSNHLINDVVLGNVVGPGGNVARLSSLEAGLPLHIPGMTIDRQCSAGLEAIRTACYFIQGQAGECYLAGGTESASTSPYENRARFSPDFIGDPEMGVAAEYVAKEFNITKDMQDTYTLLSYQRSWKAYEQGLFHPELLSIHSYDQDEAFYKKRNMNRLVKKSQPIFTQENGTVTAANSCSINDGASAVLIMEESLAYQSGHKPILRFIDSYVSGVHPHFPAISPVPAIKELLKRNSLSIEHIDLFEINEAFACKIVACSQELKIPYEKLNIHGGGLTIGHPYAASGAILVTRLFHEVQRRNDVRFVIAAIGSGGGVGVALLFEVVT